jgi:hypothetical protein
MKKGEKLNNIFDECLERLLVNGETVEQCLLSYPEYVDELESLLQTVLATKEAVAIQPRPEFKSKARYEFRLELQKVEPRRKLTSLSWYPRWAIAVVALLVILLGGGGIVATASNSMPDSFLYPVKLATEQVRLGLTFSDIGKAELHAKLADTRIDEIVYIVNEGKPGQLEKTAERLDEHVVFVTNLSLLESVVDESAAVDSREKAVMLAPAVEEAVEVESGVNDDDQLEGIDKLRSLVSRNAANHSAVLGDVLKNAPESAKPALCGIIERLEAGYDKALETLD